MLHIVVHVLVHVLAIAHRLGEDTAIHGLSLAVVSVLSKSGSLVDLLEFVELLLGDFLDLAENGPHDALSARRGGEGTVVTPELGGVDTGEELAHLNIFRRGVLVVSHHLLDEPVGFGTFDDVEEEADDSDLLGVSVLMNDVHLGVLELAVDGVLRRAVEMELERLVGSLLGPILFPEIQ